MRLPLIVALSLACLLAPVMGHAASSKPVTTTRDSVALVAATKSVSGRTAKLGLLFHMAKGWHIYWKNPGDAGQAPDVTLTAPKGAKASALSFPAPHWFVAGTVGDYVETGTVLLPFTVTLPRKPGARGADFAAKATWLVCNPQLCVPESGAFTLHLPQGPAKPSSEAHLFAAAERAMPRPSPYQARIAPDGTLAVTGAGLTRASVRSAHFFPDKRDSIANAAPQTLRHLKDGIALTLKPGSWKPGQSLGGVLVLTDESGQREALSLTATPGSVAGAAAASMPWAPMPWATALGGAFLAGIILNLMPCVFPVLAMKALALVRLGAGAQREARRESVFYTAGTVTAMLALGGALIALRAGGAALGWGFQFQSPVFVAVIAWIIVAIGLNFGGLYEIPGLAGLGFGRDFTDRGGAAGSFATGLLAVLVATPCTAPFMGAAIAAALAASAPLALAVFACLGLGIAVPFLAIGLIPGAALLFPKPGAWMLTFRQFLAFPMFATAAWLTWVMAEEAGPAGAAILAGGAVLLGFALWLLRFRGILPRGLAAVAALGIVLLLPRIEPARAAHGPALAGAVAFSPSQLAALRAKGRPVFVDMTAAWCITCQVNERVALDSAAVQAAFARHHVTLMVGDWTRRSRTITRYLAAHGRDGVPLYVYYPPGHAAPVTLPQILTEGLVERTVAGGAGDQAG